MIERVPLNVKRCTNVSQAFFHCLLCTEQILPKLVEKIDRDIIHCLACFHFPKKHQRRIRTTNLLERLNREIKRRADVVQIFPSEEACERLIGALCMEWSEEWITDRRYLDMTDLK